MNVLTRILKRGAAECRHHWHPASEVWRCCWCPETMSAELVAPRSGTAECLDAESFAATLPPARPIATTATPSRRRNRAGLAA